MRMNFKIVWRSLHIFHWVKKWFEPILNLKKNEERNKKQDYHVKIVGKIPDKVSQIPLKDQMKILQTIS